MNEPSHSCSIIDSAKEELRAAHDLLSEVQESEGDVEKLSNVLEAIDNISAAEDHVEEVRDINSELREWGQEMEDEKVALENEVEDLRDEVEKLRADLETVETDLRHKDQQLRKTKAMANDILVPVEQMTDPSKVSKRPKKGEDDVILVTIPQECMNQMRLYVKENPDSYEGKRLLSNYAVMHILRKKMEQWGHKKFRIKSSTSNGRREIFSIRINT